MEISDKIEKIRLKMGEQLLILGHYYQRASVLRHTDVKGDSLELAKAAAKAVSAKKVVMCGVRFMAESAAILLEPGKKVYMPDLRAGCPMANMVDRNKLETAFESLKEFGGGNWIIIAYVNTSAEIKAYCGSKGGITCTSSNAAKIFQWALTQGFRVLFVPDEHLGRNTARDIGLSEDAVAVYDPEKERGGLDPKQLKESKIVVWKGFCLVHTAFSVSDVLRIRERMPTAKIIVHPETPQPVVDLADAHGSTSQIINYVENQPDGSTIVIGTELNLIEALAEKHRGRLSVKALSPSVCANMAKIREENLLFLLENWPEENVISLPDSIIAESRKALKRMLEL